MWRGSVLSNYCICREISLFHNIYGSTEFEGAYGECGDILGQSLRVDSNTMDDTNSSGYYVSQFTIPVSSDTAGKIDRLLNARMMMVLRLHQWDK